MRSAFELGKNYTRRWICKRRGPHKKIFRILFAWMIFNISGFLNLHCPFNNN
jgi:hypothetical protein